MEPCLRVQLKTVWCKITLLVWADAEIIGLWEPILPGMRRKYFGELPQKTFFAWVYWALWCYLKNFPAPTRTKYARTLSARNHRFRFALCDALWLHVLIALVQKIGLLSECMQSCLCLSSVTKRTASWVRLTMIVFGLCDKMIRWVPDIVMQSAYNNSALRGWARLKNSCTMTLWGMNKYFYQKTWPNHT